jgi:hypothetical protein
MRLSLVPSALVIGSMVPDLPYYLPVPIDRVTTHTAGGVLGLDLVLGYLCFAVWQVLVAPLVVAAAPTSLRGRLAPELPVPWRRHLRGPRALAVLTISLWLGAATHVFWDEFTHANRWGYRHIGWLAAPHGPLVGYLWAQYASGVVGAALIAHSAWRWWRATPLADPQLHPQRVPRLANSSATQVWTAIGLISLVGAVVGCVTAAFAGQGLHRALFRTATWGGGTGLFAVLACALAYCATALPPQVPQDPP